MYGTRGDEGLRGDNWMLDSSRGVDRWGRYGYKARTHFFTSTQEDFLKLFSIVGN